MSVSTGAVPGRASPLVTTTSSDRYFDYCLQPYTPRRPVEGKLRGESLLWHSLRVADATDDVEAMMHAVQAAAGRDATVWGVKLFEDRLSWELYFYDPQKLDPDVRASSLTRTIAPWFRLDAQVDETWPYFMCSFEVVPGARTGDVIPALRLYFSEPVGQAGRSYKVCGNAVEFENTYHFLHPKREIGEVLSRIRSSIVVDFARRDVACVLFPELFSCHRVCVAHKRRADAVYYSGIDVDQLGWFLARFGWPEATREFVRTHAARLDHLRFDVGIDYLASGGTLVMPKTSFYSTL